MRISRRKFYELAESIGGCVKALERPGNTLTRNSWFPPSIQSTNDPSTEYFHAKQICETCPIKVECHEYGVEADIQGIIGGKVYLRPHGSIVAVKHHKFNNTPLCVACHEFALRSKECKTLIKNGELELPQS